MTLPDELFEKMDQLIALQEKQAATMRELKRAYMLANLIGMHPRDIKGGLSTAIYAPGAPAFVKPWLRQEFIVRLDGEEVARKKLTDVPLDLWPDDIRRAYETHQRKTRRARA